MVNFSSFALMAVVAASVPMLSTAAPMASCSAQSSCITFEKTLISTGSACSDGGCEWEVCATLDQSNPSCTKDGSVSHTCVKSDDTCSDSNGFKAAMETVSIPNGHRQCQIVKGGSSVEFLFKDGKGCSGSASNDDFTCTPRSEAVPSCTGNGLGKECIWTATVPECDDDPSVKGATIVSKDDAANDTGDNDGADDTSTPSDSKTTDVSCGGFKADVPFNAPDYVVDLYLDAPPCTYGAGKSAGYWVCRHLKDEVTGSVGTFSACVANDKFIASDIKGCCGDVCPTPCECGCTRKAGGSGVLIQKDNDPNCLKCYAPYGAFRKIGLQGGYSCLTDC